MAGNSKKEAGQLRKQEKAEKEVQKKQDVKNKIIDKEWEEGTKDTGRKAAEEAKRQELLRKKRENADLLKQEEESTKSAKVREGKEIKLSSKTPSFETFAATGIDDALSLLQITNSKTRIDIEKHPEKRVKSAYQQFEEREMPLIKAENTGLRLSQIKALLQKKWKKSAENPMNQASLRFDATRQDEEEMRETLREEGLNSFRVS